MKFSVALTLLAGTLAWAAGPTPLDLKTGEWEDSVTMQMTGLPQLSQIPQIPPEQLAKLPPEQRARLEAALKNAGAVASGKPTVSKTCLKKEDLANFNPTTMAKSCKMTVTSSSRTKFEARLECDNAGGKTTSTISAQALSPESLKFSVVSSGTAGGQPVNTTMNGTGRWLSSTCTESK